MSAPRPAMNPRLVLTFLALAFAAQAVFAGLDVVGDGFDTTSPLRLAISIVYLGYVALIVAFVFGVWRRARWAWLVALAIAGTGLAVAGLRLLAGDPMDRLTIGILIDAIIIWYLFRPDIRATFDA